MCEAGIKVEKNTDIYNADDDDNDNDDDGDDTWQAYCGAGRQAHG